MNPKLYFLLLSWLGCLPVMSQVTADFSAYPRENCITPYEVTFQNFSQGDTAWLWDFGDGNTSFFPEPIHLYATADTFTVSLIAFGPAGTDTLVKEDYIVTLPALPAPTLSKTRDTVLCGRGTTLRASGLHDLVWYDFANKEVARGDSLHIPIFSSNISYKVSSEEIGPSQNVGPATDTTIGPYGAFSNANRGLQFDVFRPIVLKSVLVYANSTGLRQITLKDTFGVVLKILERFIYSGAQRVPLDLKLLPGNYQLTGVNLDLYSNILGTGNPAAYPYELPDYLKITKPRGVATDYYFFYDWEVAPFCQSPFSQVDIVVNEIPKPVFSSDTVVVDCGNDGLVMVAADSASELGWMDGSGEIIALGDTLFMPFIDSSETFYAKRVYQSPVLHLGPEHPDSLGGKSVFNGNYWTHIEFDVFAPIELQSVLVQAASSGSRTFYVRRLGSNILKTIPVYLSAGDNRINLDIKLGPGNYGLISYNRNLYRNVNVPIAYPFKINNLISLTKSNDGNGNYNFYYDWQVRVLCESETDSVYFQLNVLEPPLLNKLSDTLSCGDSTYFLATSSDSLHWYDQAGMLVQKGKRLELPTVSEDVSYFVRGEYERPTMKVGPSGPFAVGPGIYSGASEGLFFTVHNKVIIKSVRIHPTNFKVRTIYIKDRSGNILHTFSRFVQTNLIRFPLHVELPPGDYIMSGVNLDLVRNTSGASYPYSIEGLLDITGSTTYLSGVYSYFYDWEVTTPCYSPLVKVDVKVEQRDKPGILLDTVSTSCGISAALIASALGNIHWYNKNGHEVGRGDTFEIPFPAASNTYLARQKVAKQTQQIGIAAPGAVGTRAYYNTTDERGLAFSVYTDLMLRSVLVEADSSGFRHIVFRLADGTLYQTRDVFIPAGISRVQLDVSFPPGQYLIGGTLLELYGTIGAIHFPISLTGILSIDAAVVSPTINTYQRFDSYYHFFDWEVETLCASDADSVFLKVDPFTSKPTVSPSSFTYNCPDSLVCYGSGKGVMWFDQHGDVISEKDTLMLDRVSSNTTFYCQDVIERPSSFEGLRYNARWDGGFLKSNVQTYLFFDVLADVNLLSFYTNADSAGIRTIFLNDSSGVPLDSFDIFIPAGRNRIPLDIQFTPGSYQIGGANLGLAYHDQDVQYPYDVGGLISVTGNNADSASYYFFFDWEVRTNCISDPVAIPVNFVPVPPPTAPRDTINILCNAADTLSAVARDQVIWLDAKGEIVGQSDTLYIHSLQDSTTFFAINETPSRFFKGGQKDSTTGDFDSSNQGGIIFDVHEDVMLRSVKVYADTAGDRLFEYRDALGLVMDSVTVFVPKGESRVYLHFPLQVGTDFELLVNGFADLYRDTTATAFPYTIRSYITLTQSSGNQPLASYNYFYDWEVGDEGCQSAAVPVFVAVAPFMSMTTISGPDSICYEKQATFSSSTTAGSWIGPQGDLLAIGDNLETPLLITGGTYSFIGESQEVPQAVGPLNPQSVGSGAFDMASTATFLHFTVESPLRFNSVRVYADTAGMRNIQVLDDQGNLLKTFPKFIPKDSSRLYLGLELQPGAYAIGGDSLHLYSNDSSANYPYSIPGLISITGTSRGSNSYAYFYDWEVQDIPCRSDTVRFDLKVLSLILPSFTYVQVDDSLSFTNISTPTHAQWHWDFGDGDSSFLSNPTHVYTDTGHFVVTLTISNGLCEQQLTDSVYIPGPSDGIDKQLLSSFRLFPNPGNGRFTVEAQAQGLRKMKVEVYDLQGRILYQSALQRTTYFHEEVALRKMAAGTYVVILWVNDARVVRRYVQDGL